MRFLDSFYVECKRRNELRLNALFVNEEFLLLNGITRE